jgi:HD-GYP domain-containing protein (c-di-GMP phosphodiesterase class II)
VNRPGFKVGIRFDQDLEQSTLDRFLIKGNLFQLSDESIVGNETLRTQVIAGIAEVRKILMTRKHIRDFYESIEKSRIDAHYIKQHILLLSQVMAGIGTKLGWVSQRSIDKLIYVAYLHDIRLGKYPHLARIPNKRIFEKKEDSLSEAERVAYLEAPSFAAEIARSDLEAYPDAIKILLQQKELPDGSGFPAGMQASGIAPLSAMFIVCHLFVDYVIDHPDWSPRDFVKTYRPRLKGQYFNKIFDSIYR